MLFSISFKVRAWFAHLSTFGVQVGPKLYFEAYTNVEKEEREYARSLQERKEISHGFLPVLNWQICQTNVKIMGKNTNLINTQFACRPHLTLLLQSQGHVTNRVDKKRLKTQVNKNLHPLTFGKKPSQMSCLCNYCASKWTMLQMEMRNGIYLLIVLIAYADIV